MQNGIKLQLAFIHTNNKKQQTRNRAIRVSIWTLCENHVLIRLGVYVVCIVYMESVWLMYVRVCIHKLWLYSFQTKMEESVERCETIVYRILVK